MSSQSKLMNRHASLEEKIEVEMKRPLPDETKLQALKKEKLFIKEQIAN